ncbi:hypothetical protein AAHC03_09674 [Spirometra sp. Aus1]
MIILMAIGPSSVPKAEDNWCAFFGYHDVLALSTEFNNSLATYEKSVIKRNSLQVCDRDQCQPSLGLITTPYTRRGKADNFYVAKGVGGKKKFGHQPLNSNWKA